MAAPVQRQQQQQWRRLETWQRRAPQQQQEGMEAKGQTCRQQLLRRVWLRPRQRPAAAQQQQRWLQQRRQLLQAAAVQQRACRMQLVPQMQLHLLLVRPAAKATPRQLQLALLLPQLLLVGMGWRRPGALQGS